MTDKYAVIGNPIVLSESPLIHKMFAEQTGQDISYGAVLTPLDGFTITVERLRKEGYKGCNVTVPFKFEAFKFATSNTPRAHAAHVANTLKFIDREIIGDNTDGAGLVADIERNLGFPLQDKRVLLMGAGGAAYGVTLPLLNAGVFLTVSNRTMKNAENLVQYFSFENGRISCNSYVENKDKQFHIVINATSSGLSNEIYEYPLLPSGIFAPGALAYDMMYGKETPFMKFAREQGAAIVSDGLGMLVEQAAEAFFIWRGVRPDTAPVLAKLRLS